MKEGDEEVATTKKKNGITRTTKSLIDNQRKDMAKQTIYLCAQVRALGGKLFEPRLLQHVFSLAEI